MKKFNYTDWVTKNKYGKTLKENFTPDLEDDERKRKLIQQMIAKEKEARKKEITGMEDVNEEPNEISYDDAKEKGLDNPNKADISKDKDISDYEFKRCMAIQKAIDQVKEMKVTDKDGNDVTSDIIKKLEKSLEDAGYTIKKGYSSDADIRPGYKTRPTKEVDDGKGGQQNPSEDEKENDNQNDLIAVFKEEDDDKKDWTPEDHEEEEEYQKYFKLESLAEALGYITKKND